MNKIIKTVKKEDKSFDSSALRRANANIEVYSPEELAHFGVIGMKWGVRKDGLPQGYQGEKTSSKHKKKVSIDVSEDKKQSNDLLKKHPDDLSNVELKRLNNRMELEANYKRLTKTDKSKFQKGYDYVKTGLAVAGTATAAYNLAKSPMMKAAQTQVNGILTSIRTK